MSAPAARFPIAGLGASAGGIEALEGFFQGIQAEAGVAYVVVTHLNPERQSLLHQVIARYTALPVEIACDGAQVRPDHVYVMPADMLLGIHDGRLVSLKESQAGRERKPIDVFLAALAEDQGEYAAAVILSGGDGDGALGVKAVKEAAGLTLAQAPGGHGPRHPSMPESAIATGLVDLAVPVEAMGRHLANFARSFSLMEGFPALGDAEPAGALEEARQDICATLRTQVGHDFSGYKAKTFLRRVQRRMQIRYSASLGEYVEGIKDDPKEVHALFRDLLINVTSFFRDAAAFAALEDKVIPRLFEGRGADETVRVWIPACATGEEVYSIAMLICEYMDRASVSPRVQIFATDIDERALAVARAGRYPDTFLDGVSPERRNRFFLAEGDLYAVAKEVRELCVFSPHSVVRDPPFSRMDMVSCRNLLIYFGPEIQGRVIPTFHYALRPGGFLFLGMSENASQFGELFTPIDKKHRIFQAREGIAAPVRGPLMIVDRKPGYYIDDQRAKSGSAAGLALRQSVESQVLERFAPAHVVVNRDGDVVYYSAKTGKYLEAAMGAPNRQLLAMARKGLRLDLRTVLRQVQETGQPTLREGMVLESGDGRAQRVRIDVEPLAGRASSEPLLLVMFTDQGDPFDLKAETGVVRIDRAGVVHLEHELRDTRERLQALIEEYETALEELKSSNEELMSVNEECQSSNEELEASKEELQSLNEELQTVNLELNAKVEALDEAHADLQNLFESSQIATVFLGEGMVIRSFTPAMAQLFNILPTDKGRPITDLTSRVALPTLAADVTAVFADARVIERRVRDEEQDADYLMRLAPYRNQLQRPSGVVATFLDVRSITRG
ncbi:chemotaxis protein CheR [Caulobacter zeae]|uniref:Chemotaxis protein CheR n=1 Tax=Caulobacter zeae TaxID=2055137 RepID=A0A2N5DPH8_9CAUL|nr:CheR family methyltransferase [Caulobacter zeae]PLR27947.1 chemotaxis protein CheR [Caulobacter zeae]